MLRSCPEEVLLCIYYCCCYGEVRCFPQEGWVEHVNANSIEDVHAAIQESEVFQECGACDMKLYWWRADEILSVCILLI